MLKAVLRVEADVSTLEVVEHCCSVFAKPFSHGAGALMPLKPVHAVLHEHAHELDSRAVQALVFGCTDIEVLVLCALLNDMVDLCL